MGSRALLVLLALVPAGCVHSHPGTEARLSALEADVGQATTSNATAIRGKPISATAPTSGQVLAYDGSQYAPTTPAGAGSAGSVAKVSAQVNSVNSGVGSFGNLHSYEVPAQADGAVVEVEAILECQNPTDDRTWQLLLGGVQVFTGPTGATPGGFDREAYRVRITRTGATTALVTFVQGLFSEAATAGARAVTGLDWSVSQTLQSQGLHASSGADYAEKVFSVTIETPP